MIINKRRGFFVFYIFLLLLLLCSTKSISLSTIDKNSNSTDIINNNNSSSNNNNNSSINNSTDIDNGIPLNNNTDSNSIIPNNNNTDSNNNSNSNSNSNSNNNEEKELDIYKFIFKNGLCGEDINITQNICYNIIGNDSTICPFRSISLNGAKENRKNFTISIYRNLGCQQPLRFETLYCNSSSSSGDIGNTTIVESFDFFDVECPLSNNRNDGSNGNDSTVTTPAPTTPTPTTPIPTTPTPTPTSTTPAFPSPTPDPGLPQLPSFYIQFIGQPLECSLKDIRVPLDNCTVISNKTVNNGTTCIGSILIQSIPYGNGQTVSLFFDKNCSTSSFSSNTTVQCEKSRTSFDQFKILSCPTFPNSNSSSNSSTPTPSLPPVIQDLIDYKILNQTYSENNYCEFQLQVSLKNKSYSIGANYSTNFQNETINYQPTYFIKYNIPYTDGQTPPNNTIQLKMKNYETINVTIPTLICLKAPELIYIEPRSSILYPYKQYFPTFENQIEISSTVNQLGDREIQGAYYSLILETYTPIHYLERDIRFVSDECQVVSFKDLHSNQGPIHTITQTMVIFRLVKPKDIIDSNNQTHTLKFLPTITLQVSFPNINYTKPQQFNLVNPFAYFDPNSNFTLNITEKISGDNEYYSNFIVCTNASNDYPSNDCTHGIINPRIKYNNIDSNNIYPITGTPTSVFHYVSVIPNKFITTSNGEEDNTADLYSFSFDFQIIPTNSSGGNSTTLPPTESPTLKNIGQNSTEYLYNSNVTVYLSTELKEQNVNGLVYCNVSGNGIGNSNGNGKCFIEETHYAIGGVSINNSTAHLANFKFSLNTTNQLLYIKLQPFEGSSTGYPYGFYYRNPFNANLVNYTISKLIPHYTYDKLQLKINSIGPISPNISMQLSKAVNVKVVDYQIKNFTGGHGIPSSIRMVDTVAPSLCFVTIKQLDFMNAILHIEASDKISGVGLIKVGPITLTSADLTKGSVFNGTFEKYLNYFNLTNFNSITLIDNVGNSKSIPYQVIWPISEPGSISNILFTSNRESDYSSEASAGIDVNSENGGGSEQSYETLEEGEGYSYTVTLNYSDTNYGSKESFTPGFQFFYSLYESSNFMKSPKYIALQYDSKLKVYRGDFHLPPFLVDQAIQYQIVSSGKVYDTSAMISLFGKSAILKTDKQGKFEQKPPIVKKITRISSSTIDSQGQFKFNASNIGNNWIGWEIQFEEDNGFQSGNITFVSEFDPIGMTSYFTLVGSKDGIGNSKLPTFSWKYKITNCRTQTYRISSMSLLDMYGHYSSTLDDLSNYINPFAWQQSYNNSDDFNTRNSIKLVCPLSAYVDVIPPTIKEFKTDIKTSLDVGSLNRTIKVSFLSRDSESGISFVHDPIVYLENSRGEKYSFKTKLVGSSRNLCNHSVDIEVPFGFGIPDGLMLSVYGVTDNQLNIGGWSANDIDLMDDASSPFIQTTYTTKPIISKASYNPISNTLLTIFGHNLQSQGSNDSEISVQIDFGSGFVVQSITFSSGLLLTINPSNMTTSKFIVKVIVDGIESNKFLVTPFIPDGTNVEPFQCPNDCGGPINGECDADLGCKCVPGKAGADCTSAPIIIDPPPVNLKAPTVLFETNNRITSLVSVIGLNEIDGNGTVVNRYQFDSNSWKFQNKSNSLSTYHYQYSTSFSDPDYGLITNLTVIIRWFDSIEQIAFAGLSYKTNPSSMKYSFKLSKYNFKSELSYLQLVMEASIESSHHSEVCSCKDFGDDSTGSEYVKLQVNGQSFYGRFLKRQLLNINKMTTTTNTILSDLKTDLPYKSSAVIGINIPYYDLKAEMDPDFTVLLESTPASSKLSSTCSNFGLTRAQILAIIAGVVIFVIALVTLTIIFVVRKYKNGSLTSLSQLCGDNDKNTKTFKSKKYGGKKIKMERLN